MSFRATAMVGAGLLWLVSAATASGPGVPFAPSGDRGAPTSTAPDHHVPTYDAVFRSHGADRDALVVAYDPSRIRSLRTTDGRFQLRGFPLSATRSVDLDLEPFTVTTDATRFVVGRKGAADRPFDFDASAIGLFRGYVVGHPDSDVFLAISPTRSTGYIQFSPGGDRYQIVTGLLATTSGEPTVRVARAKASTGAMPDVPFCAVEDVIRSARVTQPDTITGHKAAVQGLAAQAGGAAFTTETRRIRLAIETDYELFSLFGDLGETATYLTELIAAVNHIYLRDVNSYFEVTYTRLWDDPADLFNDPDPLVPFRDYWNDNMGAVERDVAHFASGRRNLPYGGIAYVGVLCFQTFSYSVTGYLLGSLEDPDAASSGHYDISVVAHELGHNCGTGHTHSYGIDTCNDFNGVPQRGTIMSYCSQTYSGGNANDDLYFHSIVQGIMEDFIVNDATCLIIDCNQNGMADSSDISGGFSLDTNTNGVPDECEDCDNDGTLDPDEIAGGSTDLNGNGIPDECEPDCNNNSVPDDRDIALSTSTDAYGNIIPDECETDCDNDGTSDYTQIQLNMSLDLNRNRLLDSCEDCDNDGTTDLAELNGAWSLWAASLTPDMAIREFHSDVGTLLRISDTGNIQNGLDLLISPSGRIFVASSLDDRVAEFDRSGTYVGDFVSAGAGGLDNPSGLEFMPGGDLLVSSRNTNSVIRYNGSTGAHVGTFVSAGAGGLSAPYGLTYGPNGNLFVTSSDNSVLEYDGATGSSAGTFVSTADNGGLSGPRGLAFKPNGNLLVASFSTNQVLEYEAGTGAFLGQFNDAGTATALTMDNPWGVRVGPNGHVFVARFDESILFSRDADGPQPLHLNAARVYLFHVDTGIYLTSYVTGNDIGMEGTTGFDFMPGASFDCNYNHHPDNCDILEGTSLDVDENGIPDECACAAPAAPSPEPGAITRNRYVAFSPIGVAPDAALRITFTALDGFPGSEGEMRWVGPPAPYIDIDGSTTFMAAALQCDPFYTDWSSISLLHVYGDGVVPGSTYSVDASSQCGGISAGAIQIQTSKWGDVVTPFGGALQPNFGDISAVVDSFRGVLAAPNKSRAQLQPGAPDPAVNVSFQDVSQTVDAFRGLSYPFAGPLSCP